MNRPDNLLDRQNDCGLPGLRQAKLGYQPAVILPWLTVSRSR